MIDTQVKINGEYHPATMVLVSSDDIEVLNEWPEIYKADRTSKTSDILEYSVSALDKLDKYGEYGRCPDNWNDFIGKAKQQSRHEVAGLFVLKCSRLADELLGFVFVRRNWDHSLVMDYLASCPKSNEKLVDVKGAGIALFLAVCRLADECGAEHFWWETTPEAASFYRSLLEKTGAYSADSLPNSILITSRELYLRAIDILVQDVN